MANLTKLRLTFSPSETERVLVEADRRFGWKRETYCANIYNTQIESVVPLSSIFEVCFA